MFTESDPPNYVGSFYSLYVLKCCFSKSPHQPLPILRTHALMQHPTHTTHPPTHSHTHSTKGMVDKLSPEFKHALTLRLRMPISDDLNPRNFITKISAYAHVIDVPNSVTILHDLLPVALAMMDRASGGGTQRGAVPLLPRPTFSPQARSPACSTLRTPGAMIGA